MASIYLFVPIFFGGELCACVCVSVHEGNSYYIFILYSDCV